MHRAFAHEFDAACRFARLIGAAFGRCRCEELQQAHHGFARCFVVPFFVAHDDFQQLIHGARPVVAGQEHTCLGKAGLKVALVGGNQLVKLFQRPLTHGVGGDKVQGIEPLF